MVHVVGHGLGYLWVDAIRLTEFDPTIPPERRGYYSDDPAIRQAAKGTEIYPWADAVEEQVKRI